MRNLLALGAAALLAFIVVGWFLGWYHIDSIATGSGREEIKVDLNKTKISEDLNKGKEKLRDMLNNNEPAQTKPATSTPGGPSGPQKVVPASVPPPLSIPGTINPGSYTENNEPPALPKPASEPSLPRDVPPPLPPNYRPSSTPGGESDFRPAGGIDSSYGPTPPSTPPSSPPILPTPLESPVPPPPPVN